MLPPSSIMCKFQPVGPKSTLSPLYLCAGLSLILQFILDLNEPLSEFLRLTTHANLEGLN